MKDGFGLGQVYQIMSPLNPGPKGVELFWTWMRMSQPPVGQDILIHEVSRSRTTTHYIRQDSSGRVISSSQRPLPDNTQHPQRTYIHATGGIRTHNFGRRAAADLRRRPRGHLDRQAFCQSLQLALIQSLPLSPSKMNSSEMTRDSCAEDTC